MKLWNYKQAGNYLKFVKKVEQFIKDNPEGTVQIYWSSKELNYEGWRKEFRKALDERINLKGGIDQKERKFSDIYQTGLMRDAISLRYWKTQRIAIRRFETKELNKRFQHILFKD